MQTWWKSNQCDSSLEHGECTQIKADSDRCIKCLERIDEVNICKLCASGPGLDYGQKVGISIGVILGSFFIALIAVLATRKKKKNRPAEAETGRAKKL